MRHHTPILLVGGAVRDWLLGKPVHDYDIGVQGDVIRLSRNIANQLNGAFYVMDAERGTTRVILPDTVLDFAACRGKTWEEDLRARDFTVNAIGFDLAKWVATPNPKPPIQNPKFLFDPLNGYDDLTHKNIRMCAPVAISDDPVRALRAIRMATVLQATLAPETQQAILNVRLINDKISIERLRDELMKILALPDALPAAQNLMSFGLLPQLLPNLPWQADHSLNQALRPLTSHLGLNEALHKQLSQVTANERTRLAILRLTVLLFQAASTNLALKLAQTLRLSNDENIQIRHVLTKIPAVTDILAQSGLAQEQLLYRFIQQTGQCAPEIFWLAQLQPPNLKTHLLIERYFAHYAPDLAPPPLLQGSDLIEMGYKPGPIFGRLLDAAREAQMVGQIHTHAEAVALVKALK